MVQREKKLVRKNALYSDDDNFVCPNCDILMKYKHGGLFVCEKCGAEQLNDFGKVKKYLNEHGPTNAIELAANTGVRRSRIGNYCANCVHTKNIQGAYIGDTPKKVPEKMRFLDLE